MIANLNLNVQVSANGDSVAGSVSLNITPAGNNLLGSQQSIATSNTPLVLGNVQNPPGGVFLRNLDVTNYVDISLDNADTQIISRLQPGQAIFITPNTNVLYAKAHTAACLLWVVAWDI